MALSTTTRKSLFGINALSAWIGLGMSTFIELFGLVEPARFTGDPPHFLVVWTQGDYASGLAGAPERLIDLFSYFTIWSQIVVGVVMTLLYLNPGRDGKLFKVFRIDSILMITVTGVVYNLLLGPNYPPQGLNQISSPIQHTITPLITVLVLLLLAHEVGSHLRTLRLHWFCQSFMCSTHFSVARLSASIHMTSLTLCHLDMPTY
jgi:hypothetical protein